MSNVPFSNVRITEFPKDLPILNRLIEQLSRLALKVDDLEKEITTLRARVNAL